MVVYEPTMQKTIFDFFAAQTSLKLVRFALEKCNQEVVKKLTFHILESCPRLKEFHFKFELDPCDYIVIFQSTEIPRFVAAISKLRHLTLTFDIAEGASTTSSCEVLRCLPSKELALVVLTSELEMNDDLWASILKNCSGLKYLKLLVTSNSTLQLIFKYSVS